MDDYSIAEFIIFPPSTLNKYTWSWEIYLPHLSGTPVVAYGIGRDREHTTQCALKALNSIRRYGKDSCLFTQ